MSRKPGSIRSLRLLQVNGDRVNTRAGSGPLEVLKVPTCCTAIAGFAGYFAFLQRRWPLASTREALQVGGAWLALTIAFEFAFGRLVAKQSWPELVTDFNLARGRTWPLVLAWIAVGPAVSRARPRRSSHARPR